MTQICDLLKWHMYTTGVVTEDVTKLILNESHVHTKKKQCTVAAHFK